MLCWCGLCPSHPSTMPCGLCQGPFSLSNLSGNICNVFTLESVPWGVLGFAPTKSGLCVNTEHIWLKCFILGGKRYESFALRAGNAVLNLLTLVVCWQLVLGARASHDIQPHLHCATFSRVERTLVDLLLCSHLFICCVQVCAGKNDLATAAFMWRLEDNWWKSVLSLGVGELNFSSQQVPGELF